MQAGTIVGNGGPREAVEDVNDAAAGIKYQYL